MRIKITKGGIYGQPTAENPTGEVPIGTELTVQKAPERWAGRYIDLDADEPADGEDVDALKARIAELEGIVADRDAEIAKLNGAKAPAGSGAGTSTTPEAKHRGAGSYSIMDGDVEIREKLTREEAEAFNALDAEGRAKGLKDNPKPVS